MFHKVKSVSPLPDYRLSVQFSEGVTKIYDVKPLLERLKPFRAFVNEPEWNDAIDLSCDELYDNGVKVDSPFDNLMSFGDATQLWGLNESTLRKAISYGKLINGQDVCKFGKQWVISAEAMRREYGTPKE